MENTDKNTEVPQSLKTAVKSRFFAQYWGQEVGVKDKFDNWTVGNVLGLDFECLELKPISKITDEDAIKVARLMTRFKWNLDLGTKVIQEENQIRIYYDAKSSGFKHTTTIYDDFFGRNYVGEPIQPLSGEIFDYLRSKGYAVPFMEYTVDDLILLGWVQLI